MIKNQAEIFQPENQTIVYVDGFNLYFGLKSKGWSRYYWLDLNKLSQNLLKCHQRLSSIKYFTSRIESTIYDPYKHKRQQTYIEALQTIDLCSIYFGHYLRKAIKCNRCGNTWESFEEKMTDVNIGIEMLDDAYCSRFDTAILISGDSDLAGPLKKIKKLFPSKRIVVAFPPNRVSKQLKQISDAYFTIGRKAFSESQFPDQVKNNAGFTLLRPTKWV